ncbi:MAG TPA: serine/threonine-protein kinase, partial [Kofleriaceae bacterium]|nr:serine/threonine-protein kinase [Kofleriaceae bacterium]
MSSEQKAVGDVHLICPSCDAEPPATGATACPSCATKLVQVRVGADDLVGQVVDGRFEIRDLLGEGGMGTVYRAWQRSIGREVAIKLIDRRYARDLMAVKRFLREARLASQLSHPHTVSVFDFGQCEDGRLFIAMELIRGRTLQDLLDSQGRFALGRALRVGVQMCDALQAAHKLKIVHRDLKLANVIVLDDAPGRDLIKVLDFGLAKSVAEAETQRTESGVVVGTPRYMSPEAASGAPPAPSADLYALGVILAELVIGKPLWQESNFAALVAQKHRRSPVLDEAPERLRPLLAALIDPDPARRPASADEVRTALLALVDDGSGTAATVQAPATPAVRSPALGSPTIPMRGNTSPRPSAKVAVPAAAIEPTAPVRASRRGPLLLVAALVIVAAVGIAWWKRGGSEASKEGSSVSNPTPPNPTPPTPNPTPPTP